jgi:hypothetical protein
MAVVSRVPKATASPYGAFDAGSASAASLGAANADFLGEGGVADAAKAPDRTAQDDAVLSRLRLRNSATNTANINAKQDRTSGTGAPLQNDVMGGATGAYNAGSDASRANFDYMHDLGKDNTLIGASTLLNRMGEDAGVSHVGDATNPADFSLQNPLKFNPLAPAEQIGNPDDGKGGQPIADKAPDVFHAINGVSTLGGAGGALGGALTGLTGNNVGDASGADRGGMTGHTPYDPTLNAALGQGQNATGLGADVLSGKTAAPNAADAGRQEDALDRAMKFSPGATSKAITATNQFQKGPKAANDVLGDLTAFTQAPEGPSAAEIQLQQQSGKNMADALSLARSGRARDAGSQARALNVAQAENAQTNADTNQQAALLRANEAATARGQNLQALGQKAGLAQGLDQNTLQALQLSGSLSQGLDQSKLQSLGLTGDLATQMRNAGIQERGQGLNFMQGQEQIGAGLTGDVLKTIPQLENVRHSDEFDLTPQQKMAQAGMGQKTALDYILGLGKDLLPLAG